MVCIIDLIYQDKVFFIKSGLNAVYKKFLMACEYKAGYINLTDILIANVAMDRAYHHFGFGSWYIIGGAKFDFSFLKNKIRRKQIKNRYQYLQP